MKKYLILFSLALMALIGCSEDFLNEKGSLTDLNSDLVFQDEALTLAVLYRTYDFLPQGYGDVSPGYGWRFMLASITDEARSKSGWIESNKVIAKGLITPDKNPLDNWGHLYKGIRRANNIIEGMAEAPLRQEFRDRVSAEARYLRAWFYFDLTRRYDGVPLILKAQTGNDDLLVPRTPRAEIYKFIDEELDAIAPILPTHAEVDTAGERGRVNRETAWALSSRMNLYAKNYAKAAASAKKVMDAGFTLQQGDYDLLFQSYGGNPEVIFEVENKLPQKGHNFDLLNLPFSLRADWGSQTNPTQEMVDAYEMAATGLPITDPASGYDPNNPYAGRDKRFYATIAYHGSFLKGKNLDLLYPGGEDAPLKTGLHTQSGYYLKKFIDESATDIDGKTYYQSRTSWKEFRLGEILLNYAEAQNEAVGPDASVYDAINQLRSRAGLPGLPSGLSQSDMRDRIRHERRIELAFENHRYFDMIRWGIAKEVMDGNKFHGMLVKDNDNDGVLEYEIFEINRPQHVFQDKNYLLPIPQDEITKNPNLKPQNPGY
ncbi:RagB/SusD family nutrient uptake outer membrane protein [Aestuariivivens insulae]|uniref:RagB/SusD family nutrient uptake outer membrane protein n=1 Tax=Aestuariivivens insulae TaxID=1621988 RepID=UPI001F5A4A77|nr:RagB/SusD family nutrient uptake outer membrane protein [Aestuariivivens insulae]